MLMAEQLSLMREVMTSLTHSVPSVESKPSRVQRSRQLAALGIENILENVETFRVCLTPDTPFMQHFQECLKGVLDDDTGAEQILEDIVIFFREKSLRLPDSQITHIERRVMAYFEKSYTDDPESLVLRWYWFYMPAIVLKDFTRAKHLSADLIRRITGVTIPC